MNTTTFPPTAALADQPRSYTMAELIDQAVNRLPRFRRRVMKRRLRNQRVYQSVVEDLTVALYDDPRTASILPVAVFAQDGFNENTPIVLDLDQFERMLQLIIEYLPQIIDVIVKLLTLFGVVLLALGLALGTGATAQAQQTVCVGGQCYNVAPQAQQPVRRVLRATTAPVRRIVAALPPSPLNRSILPPAPVVLNTPAVVKTNTIPMASRVMVVRNVPQPLRTARTVAARRPFGLFTGNGPLRRLFGLLLGR